MKTEIHQYLREDTRFRERVNKNRGLANLVMKKYGVDIPKDKRDDFISDILSGDRYWRMYLLEDETLRGSDYDTKREVEESAQLNLGYEPNHYQDVKQLNKI